MLTADQTQEVILCSKKPRILQQENKTNKHTTSKTPDNLIKSGKGIIYGLQKEDLHQKGA